MQTLYPLAPALRARIMGVSLVGAGVFLAVVTVLVMAGLPVLVLTAAVLVVVVGVFVVAGLLSRRWFVLRLDDVGYRVRFVRGAGTRAARWGDVADLQTVELGGARCVQLRLKNGTITTVPVDVVAGDPDELVVALRDHLDGTARRHAAG